MIKLNRDIYKKSEGKFYKKGYIIDFGKTENERIVLLGYAEKVTKTRKPKAKK